MNVIQNKKRITVFQGTSIPRLKIILSFIYKSKRYRLFEDKIINRNKKYIIAVNYHSVPIDSVHNFESQIKLFHTKYENVNKDNLESFLKGDWPYKKPGIMLHFDDGLSEHHENVAPVLDKYGFTGWYHVITDNIDNHRAIYGKDSMTWHQARDLAKRGHEICSHSCTHKRLRNNLSDEEIRYEVCQSYERLCTEMGSEPTGFCYPGGEIDAYDIRAIKLIKSIYKYAFPSYTRKIITSVSPYAVNRANIESTWPLSAVNLSIGPLWQLKHWNKAYIYNKLLME